MRRRMGNRVVHVVVNMRLTGILLRVVKPVKSLRLKINLSKDSLHSPRRGASMSAQMSEMVEVSQTVGRIGDMTVIIVIIVT